MQPQTSALAFLQELFLRLKTKSPKFFQIWTWIGAALTMVTTLPALLAQIESLGIVLPEIFHAQVAIAVRYSGIGILFMSLLTTQSKPTAITEDGTILKKTDEKRLPFTAGHEDKVATREINKGNIAEATIKPAVNEQSAMGTV